eukprot:gnl/Chilomastix_cuspidata/10186.p2 GENE.gnl/Chilomastix_cuspidata/10186~~gnl/Chilomastix_cuspidata/10186.p2  ORF type:complete len:174 (+),score=7.03 gnl/Chilomastix_cuspidata/10186:487-1008(+)
MNIPPGFNTLDTSFIPSSGFVRWCKTMEITARSDSLSRIGRCSSSPSLRSTLKPFFSESGFCFTKHFRGAVNTYYFFCIWSQVAEKFACSAPKIEYCIAVFHELSYGLVKIELSKKFSFHTIPFSSNIVKEICGAFFSFFYDSVCLFKICFKDRIVIHNRSQCVNYFFSLTRV